MELRKLALWLGIGPAVLGASLFAGCGGGGGGTGSDEDFVADLCDLFKGFSEDLENIDPSDISDEDDVFAAFAEPFEDLANDFEDLNPPADLKDWHDDASKALKDAAKAMKDGEVDEELLSGNPIPEPPKDAADRLSKLAEENEDCDEEFFDFDS